MLTPFSDVPGCCFERGKGATTGRFAPHSRATLTLARLGHPAPTLAIHGGEVGWLVAHNAHNVGEVMREALSGQELN